MQQKGAKASFSKYQKLVIFLVALVNFTIILDFMVMAPLGDMLMKTMHLNAKQFASAVSAYAFSAGISGLLAAGFADKFDRKKLLIFFYSGFIIGTFICGVANSYIVLMAGRIVTGVFAGVLGSVTMAIIADLFTYQQRGRVMGFVQMSFAVSQVMGIPVGLYLANNFGWEAPFFLIVGVSLITVLSIVRAVKPVDEHLHMSHDLNPVVHLTKTIASKEYWIPFIATALLSIGGFMMMPFSTPFVINNVGIKQEQLPVLYVVTGIGSMIILPLIGKVSDKFGKLPTFLVGTVLAMIMIVVFTHLPPVPLWQLIVVNTIMFASIMSRMIPSQALLTAIPRPDDRGAFMSVNSSLQQVAGGFASIIAGWVIMQDASGRILHFDILGFVAMAIMVICAFLIYIIHGRVMRKLDAAAEPVNTEKHFVVEN